MLTAIEGRGIHSRDDGRWGTLSCRDRRRRAGGCGSRAGSTSDRRRPGVHDDRRSRTLRALPPAVLSPFAIGRGHRPSLDGLAGPAPRRSPRRRPRVARDLGQRRRDVDLRRAAGRRRREAAVAVPSGAGVRRAGQRRAHARADPGSRGRICQARRVRRPSGASWPLPIYELALLTAARAFDMCIEVELTVVTPEPAPLAVFGEEVARDVAQMLADAGIAVRCRVAAEPPRQGVLRLHPTRDEVEVERVVTLPILNGPAIDGLPHDEPGFLPVDAHGRVAGVPGVYAAGDATDFAIKQGGHRLPAGRSRRRGDRRGRGHRDRSDALRSGAPRAAVDRARHALDAAHPGTPGRG